MWDLQIMRHDVCCANMNWKPSKVDVPNLRFNGQVNAYLSPLHYGFEDLTFGDFGLTRVWTFLGPVLRYFGVHLHPWSCIHCHALSSYILFSNNIISFVNFWLLQTIKNEGNPTLWWICFCPTWRIPRLFLYLVFQEITCLRTCLPGWRREDCRLSSSKDWLKTKWGAVL